MSERDDVKREDVKTFDAMVAELAGRLRLLTGPECVTMLEFTEKYVLVHMEMANGEYRHSSSMRMVAWSQVHLSSHADYMEHVLNGMRCELAVLAAPRRAPKAEQVGRVGLDAGEIVPDCPELSSGGAKGLERTEGTKETEGL